MIHLESCRWFPSVINYIALFGNSVFCANFTSFEKLHCLQTYPSMPLSCLFLHMCCLSSHVLSFSICLLKQHVVGCWKCCNQHFHGSFWSFHHVHFSHVHFSQHVFLERIYCFHNFEVMVCSNITLACFQIWKTPTNRYLPYCSTSRLIGDPCLSTWPDPALRIMLLL